MSQVGGSPTPPRIAGQVGPLGVAPSPTDLAPGNRSRQEQRSADDQQAQGKPASSAETEHDPAVRIAGSLTALFTGKIVTAKVVPAPPGAPALLLLPEAKLIPMGGTMPEGLGDTVAIRLVRGGNEPSIELIDPDGQSLRPPVILKVGIAQIPTASDVVQRPQLRSAGPPPHATATVSANGNAVFPSDGVVTLLSMAGRSEAQLPANAAYLHVSSLLPESERPAASAPSAAERLIHPQAMQAWEALLAALSATDKALDRAQNLLQASDGKQRASALLFLFAVLRHGTLQNWLGDEASALLSKRPATGRLAAQSFDEISRIARSPSADGWHTVPLAIGMSDAVQPIMLYFHRPPRRRKTDPDPRERSTRFMLDAVFSRAGPIRIDGLFGRGALNIILRSERRIPPLIATQLSKVYGDALSAASLTGSIDFQAVAQLPAPPGRRLASAQANAAVTV